MISKGFNFPKLNCIVVIDADFSGRGYDLRTTEKNIQLYHQLSGRAGRFSSESLIIYQTLTPYDATLNELIKNKSEELLSLDELIAEAEEGTDSKDEEKSESDEATDLEKLIEENEDPIVTNRGKQTEALINTTNKHIKDQIKKGNIKKEDLLLKQDSNGLMVNKNKTIAIRDSFMAKQFDNGWKVFGI